MKKTMMTLIAVVVTVAATGDELRPIKYEATTNWLAYQRLERRATNTIHMERTNAPAALIHAVTYGRGTNAVFVLKTCEPLPTPSATNGWTAVELRGYRAQTWVESPPPPRE